MPTYKLLYYNLNALAEPIRWIFKVAGVDFEDERIEFADWEKVKEKYPIKQLPLLFIDGVAYTQTNAICRYLGRTFGLVPDDDLLTLKVDQVAGILADSRTIFHKFFAVQDPEKKEEVRKELLTTSFPPIAKQLSDIIASTEGDFIAGTKLTWVDLLLGNGYLVWQTGDPTILEKYPVLIKHRDAVLAVPAIKNWLEIRPKVKI